jgi:anti-sigma B factor antagonist
MRWPWAGVTGIAATSPTRRGADKLSAKPEIAATSSRETPSHSVSAVSSVGFRRVHVSFRARLLQLRIPMEGPFSVKIRGEFTVVEFQTASLMNAGELERISKALNDLVENDRSGRVVLDFTPVRQLASQAIGIIVSLHKKTAAVKGGKLVLCGLSPQLLQLLKITRIDRLLKIVKDQKEATGV